MAETRWGGEISLKTARGTTGTTLVTGAHRLFAINLEGSNTEASSVTVYDNTSATGTIVCVLRAITNTSRPFSVAPGYIDMATGSHVVIEGTGVVATLYYKD